MTVFILVGPPCSGKSTWAKKFLNYGITKNCIRVNRDELRIMFKGKYVSGNPLVENQVNEAFKAIAYNAYANNLNLIVDATHCKMKYINDIKNYLKDYKTIRYSYIVFSVPYWKQRVRNFFRYLKTGIWIPKEVSNNMNKNFLVTKELLKDEQYLVYK